MREAIQPFAKCGMCHRELPKAELQCPNCASTVKIYEPVSKGTGKIYEMEAAATIGLGPISRARKRVPGIKHWLLELISGREWWRSKARWAEKSRVIDREHDRYFEHVVDPVTGEEIHRCEERLSDHIGHSSEQK
jgi:hypothetical protein